VQGNPVPTESQDSLLAGGGRVSGASPQRCPGPRRFVAALPSRRPVPLGRDDEGRLPFIVIVVRGGYAAVTTTTAA